ncbi:hypothetical protein B0H13DRAFT_1856458 [Mycena leptocephala]|nr:hypothetical protein B0H13DRAFT_1856458 [Mycena leptocephala]
MQDTTAVEKGSQIVEFRDHAQNIYPDDVLDPIYQAKADNIWPTMNGLILVPVINEFEVQGPFLKLGQNICLLVGATFWGIGADIWGRKISFNLTMLITGVFGVAAGGSPSA